MLNHFAASFGIVLVNSKESLRFFKALCCRVSNFGLRRKFEVFFFFLLFYFFGFHLWLWSCDVSVYE